MFKKSKFIIGCLDTETTGTKHGSDRVIEFGMTLWTFEDIAQEPVSRKDFVQRYKPGDKAINPDAQAVHGISAADLEKCRPFAQDASAIKKAITAVDLVVGHNLVFDLQMLDHEFNLCSVPIDWATVPIFCTMVNGRFATPNGKNPRLSELRWAYGMEYSANAHSALADSIMTIEAWLAGVRAGDFKFDHPKVAVRSLAA